MSAIEPFCRVFHLHIHSLSKAEVMILEAEIFIRIYEELMDVFRLHYKNYFRLLKLDEEKERLMLEANFLRYIIHDLLSIEAYSLQGIACYANVPEEIIYEVASGCNANPSLMLSRKIIDLHRQVRGDWYEDIVKRICLQPVL